MNTREMLVITNNERNYIVYCHVFSNDKKYFGITCQGWKKRWGKGGIGYKGQLVYDAIEKYGWYNTKHYILFKNLTEEEAEQKEIELIARYNTTDRRYGYNVSAGGDTPLLTGANNPNSVKIVCINTEEVFDTINEAAIKYNLCSKCISDCCKGKQSIAGNHPETGERMIWQYYDEWLAAPKKHIIDYTKTESEKRVVCIETGIIYNNMVEAAKSINVKRSCISSVCRGKQRTSGGYHWAYYDDYIKDPDKYNKLKHNNCNKPNNKPKRVLCVETNVIYNSITEAANSVGVYRTNVGGACRGEQKTAGGYHWKYIND